MKEVAVVVAIVAAICGVLYYISEWFDKTMKERIRREQELDEIDSEPWGC